MTSEFKTHRNKHRIKEKKVVIADAAAAAKTAAKLEHFEGNNKVNTAA